MQKTVKRVLQTCSAFTSGMMLCMTITGCGQKGDLYLPTEPPPPVRTDAPCRASDCTNQETDESTPKETQE